MGAAASISLAGDRREKPSGSPEVGQVDPVRLDLHPQRRQPGPREDRRPRARPSDSRPKDQNFRTALLVSPPIALAGDVFALPLTEIGRAEDEDLETLWPGLVASPRTGRDAHRVPFLELDDLVVDLHPPTPAHGNVHLLLLLVRVAERKAIAGRDALVAQAGLLELERLGRHAELQVRRAVEPRAEVLQVLLEVPERERHGAILWHLWLGSPPTATNAC